MFLLHPLWSDLSLTAGLRRHGGVCAQAGEAQRRPRLPSQVPHRKLPSVPRGRPGPAGALVPRSPGGGLHAPAGVQGKRVIFQIRHIHFMSVTKARSLSPVF